MNATTNRNFMQKFRERLALRGVQVDRVYFNENVKVMFSKTDGPYTAETSREFAYEFYQTPDDQMEVMAVDIAAYLNEAIRVLKERQVQVRERYLGNGVYAAYDADQHIVLTTNLHSEERSDTIYLNGEVWSALVKFMEWVNK